MEIGAWRVARAASVYSYILIKKHTNRAYNFTRSYTPANTHEANTHEANTHAHVSDIGSGETDRHRHLTPNQYEEALGYFH